MTDLVQTLVSGLSIGLVIGGLAVALAVGFQGSGILNFSQGQFATFSAYIAWQLADVGMGFWPALLVSALVSFVVALAVQQVFISPVLGGEELPILIVTVALFLLVDSVVGSIWGYLPKSLDGPARGVSTLGHVVVTHQVIVQAVVLVATVAAVSVLFRSTSVGLHMRAAASNPRSSELCGVNLRWTLAIGWGIAGAVGALTASVSAPVTGLSPDGNSSILLLAFAAAALGGFHSRVGAFVGGLIVGVVTALAGEYISFIGNDLRLLVPLVVIILSLLVAPDGIFSSPRKQRV